MPHRKHFHTSIAKNCLVPNYTSWRRAKRMSITGSAPEILYRNARTRVKQKSNVLSDKFSLTFPGVTIGALLWETVSSNSKWAGRDLFAGEDWQSMIQIYGYLTAWHASYAAFLAGAQGCEQLAQSHYRAAPDHESNRKWSSFTSFLWTLPWS